MFITLLALARAIDNARSTKPERIWAALAIPNRDTIMPCDGIKFDDKHQNTGAHAVVEQYLHGSWKVVYPADVASTQIVWPAQNARTSTGWPYMLNLPQAIANGAFNARRT